MKKILIVITFFSVFRGISQDIKPIVWLKADIVNDSLVYWQNIMNDTLHAKRFSAELSMSSINFNPSIMIENVIDGYELELDLNKKSTMTSIVVFQILDTLNECGIWGIDYLNDRKLLLTSKNYHTPKKIYHYTDTNSTTPEINTLVYNINKADVDSLNILKIGRYDTIPFNGMIAEYILFDKPIRGNDLLIYQSYLAIKYGVTLIDKDYINSNSDIIWQKDSIYYNNIAGISKDTILQLNQKQSHSTFLPEITMGVNSIDSSNALNQSALIPMGSVIWADNGIDFSEREFVFDSFGMPFEVTMKKWKVQVKGQNNYDNYQIVFAPDNFELKQSDECVLLIDRSGNGDFSMGDYDKLLPDSISVDGKVCFSNVNWDIDGNGVDVFSFSIIISEIYNSNSSSTQIGDIENEDTRNKKKEFLNKNEINDISVSVIPNPNNGDFFIRIDGMEMDEYTIVICDSRGGSVSKPKTYSGYKVLYKETIDKPGVYFVKIQSEKVSKIVKVVIN
ncbi:MAG: T9SS type A sorting domain-containing protein [Bacteroidales bacterium]|nr:T9SS type A sorting domain-containing protein [Bacteroidales bacterium]